MLKKLWLWFVSLFAREPMPSALDQAVAKCDTILQQCLIAANSAAAAAAVTAGSGLAPLVSPHFQGVPTAPTASLGDATNTLATTGFLARLLGAPSGIALLDPNSLIPIANLPFTTLTFDGVWDAATNTPTLASSSGTAGHYRIVQVAGSTTLNGISTWGAGDQAIFNGSVWQRVPYITVPIVALPLSSLEAIATPSVVGNISGGSATPSAITISSITAFLSTMVGDSGSGGVKGLVPAAPPLSGTGSFLRADGTFATLPLPDLSGFALLNSPAFTGTATVSTQARNTQSSAIASTQFVVNQQAQSTEALQLQMSGSAGFAGTSTYSAKIDHIHPGGTTQGFLFGLTCSNGTGSATKNIGVTSGQAMDSTNAQMMTLPAALEKRFDQTWAPGNNAGGMQPGQSLPVFGTLHIWLISGANGTGVDIVGSTTNPPTFLPGGCIYQRRIASFPVGGVGSGGVSNIATFRQLGDQFFTTSQDILIPSGTVGQSLISLSNGIPSSIVVQPKLYVKVTAAASAAITFTVAPVSNGSLTQLLVDTGGNSTQRSLNTMDGPPTDNTSAARILYAITGAGTFSSNFGTQGWIDTRGRLN
jgi:hypothetical protein